MNILHADWKDSRAVPSNIEKTCYPEAKFYLGCRMTEIISSSFNFWVSKGKIREVTLSKWPLVSMETPAREYKCKKIANFILWKGEDAPPPLRSVDGMYLKCLAKRQFDLLTD